LTWDPDTEKTWVFATGAGSLGQLGLGPDNMRQFSSIQRIEFFDSYSIIDVTAGENHSLVLGDSGRLWTFGCNKYGQLGLGCTGGTRPSPVVLDTLKDVLQVSCGTNHSAALTGRGLYVWGHGVRGQIGNGELKSFDSPQLVDDINLSNFKTVRLGYCHSAVVGYEDTHYPISLMFLYTERVYLHKLKYLVANYLEPLRKRSATQANLFFGLLPEVVAASRRIVFFIMSLLRGATFRGKPVTLGTEFLKSYSVETIKQYCEYHLNAVACNKFKEDRVSYELSEVLHVSKGDSIQHTLDRIKTRLMLPLRRVAEYLKLFKSLIQETPKQNVDRGPLVAARGTLKQLWRTLREEETLAIRTANFWDETKNPSLLALMSPTRRYVQHFSFAPKVVHRLQQKNFAKIMALYIFNDVIVAVSNSLASKASDIKIISVSTCWIQDKETEVVIITPEDSQAIRPNDITEKQKILSVLKRVILSCVRGNHDEEDVDTDTSHSSYNEVACNLAESLASSDDSADVTRVNSFDTSTPDHSTFESESPRTRDTSESPNKYRRAKEEETKRFHSHGYPSPATDRGDHHHHHDQQLVDEFTERRGRLSKKYLDRIPERRISSGGSSTGSAGSSWSGNDVNKLGSVYLLDREQSHPVLFSRSAPIGNGGVNSVITSSPSGNVTNSSSVEPFPVSNFVGKKRSSVRVRPTLPTVRSASTPSLAARKGRAKTKGITVAAERFATHKFSGKDPSLQGCVYEGQWVMADMEGRGIMKFPDGSTYNGEWRRGNFHGHGRWQDAKHIYEGEWVDGKKEGFGWSIQVWSNNTFRYEGHWKTGQRHGFGVATFGSGGQYSGWWANDNINGCGAFKWNTGDRFFGLYKDSKVGSLKIFFAITNPKILKFS